MVRPPGHHSGLKSQPHGFSFFNNIALAAYQTIAEKKGRKIAIVDWDVHHGEGTQKIFYNRKDVLFISLHRFDNGKFFPHIQ
jgi:acetoin utilization deacetylase AcuC-like enzyme